VVKVTTLIALSVMFLVVTSVACAQELEAEAQWTVLVFVNADNNLDGAGVDDLGEMEDVGSTDKVNIVVQMDRRSSGAKRYFVERGSSEVLDDMGEIDMGDWRQLVDFASWGIENYPAKRYALVVWNHGSGWNKHRIMLDERGISYDDTDNNHITTLQLEEATIAIEEKLGRNLDILGFDACLMNMIEVAYQVRENCDLVVGSEETEPGDGWPYDKILKKLVARPTASSEKFAEIIVEQYAKSYGIRSTTQSAIRCASLAELTEKLTALAIACKESSDAGSAIDTALKEVTRFYYKSYIDLFHFVSLFKGAVGDASCRDAAKAVLALEKKTIAANKVSGLPFMKKKARGISLSFPEGYGYTSAYDKLAFAKDSQWDELLRWHLKVIEEGPTQADKRLELLRR